MATSYTYSSLLDAVQEWLEDDSTEFTTAFPNICDLAEIALIKDLGLAIFDQESTGTLTTAFLTKPTGYLNTVDLFITVSGAQVLLQPRTWGYVAEYGGTGTPIYYAEKSTTQLQVAPVPTSQAYTLRYVVRPTPLSETTGSTTTWLSANVPDCMFLAALMASINFLKMDERMAAVQQMYQAAVASAKQEHQSLVRRTYP